MNKKITFVFVGGIILICVAYVIYDLSQNPSVGATLAEANNSSCAITHLCDYDGISYSYLIEKKGPVKDYPKTKSEFDLLKSTLK